MISSVPWEAAICSLVLSLRVLWYSGIPRFLGTLTFNFFLPPTQYCPVSSFSLWYFCGYSRLGVKNGTLKKIMRQSRPKYTNKSRNLSYRKKPAVSWPEFLRIWLLHMTSFFLVFLSSKSPYHTLTSLKLGYNSNFELCENLRPINICTFYSDFYSP